MRWGLIFDMSGKKDVGLFLITKIITGIVGIFSVSLQTKFLSSEALGNFSLINGVVTALVAIMIGWIGSSALRYYYSYEKDDIAGFHTTIFIDWIVMLLASAAVVVLLGFIASNLPISNYLLFTLIFLLFASTMEILEKMMRASKHNIAYCILMLVESATNIIILLSFHKVVESGVNLLLFSRIATASLFSVSSFFILKFYKYIKPKSYSFNINKVFFKYGFPMVGIWGIGWLLSYSDRYIINHFLSASQVGLYDVAYSFSEKTMGIVVSAFGLAFFPMLIRVWKDQGKEATVESLKQAFSSYFILSIPMCVGIGFLSYYFYGPILNPDFKEAYLVMPITCFGFFVSGMTNFLYKMWQLEEKTGKVLLVTAIAVVVNIVSNIIFIPLYGYIVAAITTSASYLVAFLITFIIVKIKFGVKIDLIKLLKIIFASCLMGVYLFFIKRFAINIWFLLLIVFGGVVIYFGSLFAIGGLKGEITMIKKWIGKNKNGQENINQ